MTIASETARDDYLGNGSTADYDYNFRITDQTHLSVVVREVATGEETELTLTTHYTVSGVGNAAGGTVSLVNSAFDWIDGSGFLDDGWALTILPDVPYTQTSDLRNQGTFRLSVQEDALDRGVRMAQQNKELSDRSIKLPKTVAASGFSTTLPGNIADLPGRAVGVNSTGDGFDLIASIAEVSASVFGALLAAAADAAAARALLDAAQKTLFDAFHTAATGAHPQATATGQAVRWDEQTKAHNDNGTHKKRDFTISGLTLSNNLSDATNDVDIAAGTCIDLTADADETMALASALTKRLDAAWAVGTGNGGLDTGSIADTTYHVWLIKRSDTGVVDALFSASATAPTMPEGYDIKRPLGRIRRVSSAIVAFTQTGDEFLLKTPVQGFSASEPGTNQVAVALPVPTGVRVTALASYTLNDNSVASTTYARITSPDQNDLAASAQVHDLAVGVTAAPASTYKPIRTNTSAQVYYRLSASTADHVLFSTVFGWIDRRGQDGSVTN